MVKKQKEKIQMTETHGFGGNWTEEKLKRVEKYLKAYTAIMNKQNFLSACDAQAGQFVYIDALAGNNVKKLIY
jgi:hypothetical protein